MTDKAEMPMIITDADENAPRSISWGDVSLLPFRCPECGHEINEKLSSPVVAGTYIVTVERHELGNEASWKRRDPADQERRRALADALDGCCTHDLEGGVLGLKPDALWELAGKINEAIAYLKREGSEG